MDSYNQIKVTVPVCDLQLTSDVMTMMNFTGGIMIEDYSDIDACPWDYVDTEILGKDRTTASVSGFVPSSEDILPVIEQLKLLLPVKAKTEIITVEQSDWANNWKKYYKPVRVGKNIVIKPSWEQYDKKETDVIVELDPGMAFGTGTHETTRMCMELLERFVKPDTSVLDVGCGSGILSITSLLLGAKNAVGVDIDPVAVSVAIENGERNNFTAPRYVIKKGNLVDEIEGKYDIAVANIVADAIIMLCPDVLPFIKDDGYFICSGIIEDRIEDVKEKLTNEGYIIQEILQQGEWCAMRLSINRN